MKLKMNLIVFLCMALGVLPACSSDNDPLDDGGNTPEQAVLTAFSAKYSGATDVTWKAKGDYWEADFDLGNVDYDAWFGKSGVWLREEYEMNYSDVPQPVKAYIEGSINYPPASWTPDQSVEVVKSLNAPVWYGIELENAGNEVRVWADASGDGIKDVSEDYSGSEIPVAISSWILKEYPKSVTLEVEKIMNLTFEATILDANQVKTVYFDRSSVWTHTTWFVAKADVPQVVLDVLSGQAYADYSVKQVQYQQYSSGDYYHFLLEKTGSLDMTVNIDPEGNIVLD